MFSRPHPVLSQSSRRAPEVTCPVVAGQPGLHLAHSCSEPSRWSSSTRNRVSRTELQVPLEAGVKRRRRRNRVDDEPITVTGEYMRERLAGAFGG